MQPSDLLVEVRDVNLVRLAQIEPHYLDLTATLRDSGVGEWSLRLPAEHRAATFLRQPGAGVVVTGPSGVLFSGPTAIPTVDADLADPTGIATFTGVTDDSILWQRLAYPSPGTASVEGQVAAYDVRTGTAEAVMRAYVDANVGPGAPVERRVKGLALAASLNRGRTVTKSARFDVLGDLLREIATVAGLRFRVVQVGTTLRFEVLPVADRRAEVRFDLGNGTLASQSVATSPPGLTRAIVAGQGQGEARTFLERTTPESLAAETVRGPWGRIERFIDQRNTDDPAELAQAGDKALREEGFIATAVKAVPSDDLTMRFALHWDVGDAVTVVVAGQETTSTVTSATIIANAEGVKVGATIGDTEGFDPRGALGAQVEDTVRRVSNLERNVAEGGTSGATPAAALPTGALTLWAGPSSAPPSGFLVCTGQAVSRSTYARLYSAIGTAYGAGDGSATFNLPDLRGRVPVGVHTADADFADRGTTGGAKAHTLTAAEMPSHTHKQDAHGHTSSTASAGAHSHDVKYHAINANGVGLGTSTLGFFFLRRNHAEDGSLGTSPAALSSGAHTHTVTVASATATNQSTGGGGAHNNMQPFVTTNYIIKT